MIRLLTVLGSACLVGAIVLALIDTERYIAASLIMLLAAFVILGLLGIRRGFYKAKGIVDDARAFMSGDIQHARLVSVGELKGWIAPRANVVLELEGEDGTKHRFDHDVPIPWPMAISYRLGKRFNVPGMRADPTEMMAMELKREGLSVSVARPSASGQ